MEAKKIVAIALVVLGVITLAFSSVSILMTRLSLPPYSLQTEGKYVAYSLQLWTFLFTLPIIVSLFLIAYLVFPSMFRRFYIAVRVVSALLAVGGIGVTALLIGSAVVNNVSPLLAAAGASPFWIMTLLAILALKKSEPR